MNRKNNLFKNLGPAFLVIALGIGSGEFILWPYLTANYGFGILYGALFGIFLQLVLINMITKNTILLKEDIVSTFKKVFRYSPLLIIFTTILGFGWPAFAALSAELITNFFLLSDFFKYILPIIFLTICYLFLVISKNSYKSLLFLQKINILILFSLSLFLFIFYFDFQEIKNLIMGFFGIGNSYIFFPAELSFILFFSAIVYAGSGGNLILANSFYLNKKIKEKEKVSKKFFLKNSLKENFYFFFIGGLFIISILSYISYISLKNNSLLLDKDFSFLILESQKFSTDISPIIGILFLLSGCFAIFGVQMGIYDFLGRLYLNIYKKNKKEEGVIIKNEKAVYNKAVLIIFTTGFLILILGFNQPKFLISTGAIINSLSMAFLALMLFIVEKKIFQKEYKNFYTSKIKKIFYSYSSFLIFLFYFIFFCFTITLI